MHFTYHKDIPNNQWNIYEVVDGHEIYLFSFPTLQEAQDFCNVKNGAKVKAE